MARSSAVASATRPDVGRGGPGERPPEAAAERDADARGPVRGPAADGRSARRRGPRRGRRAVRAAGRAGIAPRPAASPVPGGPTRPGHRRRPRRSAAATAARATSTSVRPEPRARASIACRYRSRVAKSIAPNELAGPQDLVDEAHALDELGPVEPRDEAHARDHVPDGHVHRRLALVLEPDGLLGRRALGDEALLEPAERRRRGRVLVAEALEELDPAGRRQRRRRSAAGATPPRPPGSSRPRPRRLSASSSARCRAARLPTICSAIRRRFSTRTIRRLIAIAHSSPMVSGSTSLVGGDHATQALGVEAAVRVGDVGPGEAHDARVALEVALGELGKLAVVVRPGGRRGSRGAARRRCGSCRRATRRRA